MTPVLVVAFAAEDAIAACNHFAMAIGSHAAEGRTYGYAGWENDAGKYCARDVMLGPAILALADKKIVLPRPAWDADGIIDMDAAREVHRTMQFWQPPPEGADPEPFPIPRPGVLTVFVGLTFEQTVAAAGLARVVEG